MNFLSFTEPGDSMRVHKNSSLGSVLLQRNPFQRWYSVPSESIIIIFFSLRLMVFHFSFSDLKILWAFLISPILVTFSVRLIFHDLFTLIKFGGECKLWISSSSHFLHSPIISSLSATLCSRCTNFNVLYGTCASNIVRSIVKMHVRLPETGTDSTVLHTSGTTEHNNEPV
jgi:hypothetical protein